jgi:hypothetical protein
MSLLKLISPIRHGLATAVIPDIPVILLITPQLLHFNAVLTTGKLPTSRLIAASAEELLMISSLLLRLAESTNLLQTASAIKLGNVIAKSPML